MKNMLKKALATLAALAVMMSVVMPCAADPDDSEVETAPGIWDEHTLTNRN